MADTLKERLYAKLPNRPADKCWEFVGGTTNSGYGVLYTHSVGRRSISTGAHRAAWEVHHGPIPTGLHVLHHCDNRLCCNPTHLFIGTAADNHRDKSRKGRAQAGPCADAGWWTPERRATRAKVTGEKLRRRRAHKQALAGVSPDTKFCPTCRRWLPHEAFGRSRRRFDGLQGYCKPCKNAADIARRRRKTGQIAKPRRATRSDKKHFISDH